MIAFMTLCMVVLPGLLLVLVCGLIEWLISKMDKQDKLLLLLLKNLEAMERENL